MKHLITVIGLIFIASATAAANRRLTLGECVDAAVKNRPGIQAARTDRMAAGLLVKEAAASYLPQVSASYNYRYYAIIPTQVVPIGLFYSVPTDEVRGMKFGTPWQQNAGISLYQPVIDLTVRSRLRESRINEKLSESDLADAEDELKSEVISSYLNVWLKSTAVEAAIIDTARTYATLMLLRNGAAAGRVQAYDINRAQINHNRNLASLSSARTALATEKIYLSFLTGFPVKDLMDGDFDFAPFKDGAAMRLSYPANFDSIASIRKLRLDSDLANQQASTEKNSRRPSLGIEGFLGANQFDAKVAPFDQGTWHGNSYVGLSLRLPITGGTGTRDRVSRLKMQAMSGTLRLQDERDRVTSTILRKQQEIEQYMEQIELTERNISLLKANLDMYRERYGKGLENSFDLAGQETDLQKEENELMKAKAGMMIEKLDLIKQSGMINDFLKRAR